MSVCSLSDKGSIFFGSLREKMMLQNCTKKSKRELFVSQGIKSALQIDVFMFESKNVYNFCTRHIV